MMMHWLVFVLLMFMNSCNLIISWDNILIVASQIEEHDVFLTQDDFINAINLPYSDDFYLLENPGFGDPTLLANMFEGDIFGFPGRVKPENRLRLWKNAEVPYTLSSRYTAHGRSVIARAVAEIEKFSCVKFVPKNLHNTDFIYIYPDPNEHCFSSVGRIGGRQLVSLNEDCMQIGSIIHEFMHALGFVHEQSRPDRDQYVKIFWSNIQHKTEEQFQKYSSGHVQEISLPYDYSSIMHYSPYAFTRNGLPTIKALKKGGESMGQREGLSVLDVKKLNNLYNCPNKTKFPTAIRPSTIHYFSTRKPYAKITLAPQLKTIAPGPSICRDKSTICYLWQVLDNCQTYPNFMRYYCPKTCGYCSGIKDIATIITTARPTVRQISTTTINRNNLTTVCQDDFPFSCKLWAESGDCENLKVDSFMHKYCKKSCKVCHTNEKVENRGNFRKFANFTEKSQNSTENCVDTKYSCDTWATDGLCRNDTYVQKHCPKKCGLCSKNAIPTTWTTNGSQTNAPQACKNFYLSCNKWADAGFCEKLGMSEFVKEKCPLACGICRNLL